MKSKFLVIGLLLFALTACGGSLTTIVTVDNRTTQDFIVVIDDSYVGHLVAGGVDSVWVGHSPKQYQLRWIDEHGVNVLYISIDKTMKTIFIQGREGNYSVEFVHKVEM